MSLPFAASTEAKSSVYQPSPGPTSSTVIVGLRPKNVIVSSGWRYLSRSAFPGLRCGPAMAARIAASRLGYALSAMVLAVACISGVHRRSSALCSACHAVRSSSSFFLASAVFLSSAVGMGATAALAEGAAEADAPGGAWVAEASGAEGGGSEPPHAATTKDEKVSEPRRSLRMVASYRPKRPSTMDSGRTVSAA